MAENQDLAQIVQSFRDTTKRLADLHETATQLSEASVAFETAANYATELAQSSAQDNKEHLTKVTLLAEESLSASRTTLRDATRSVVRLTEELQDVSHELSEIADLLRRTDPELTRTEVKRNRLEIRITLGLSLIAATAALISAIF